jgi:hypothetical protein
MSPSIGLAKPTATQDPHPAEPAISSWMTVLFATACGLLVVTVHYFQPIAGPISHVARYLALNDRSHRSRDADGFWSWLGIDCPARRSNVGLGSVAVQALVPYATHMAPEKVRGSVVGKVMSGPMIGIMLARPALFQCTAPVRRKPL